MVGKRVPYVPDWRAKLGVTYRPNESWAYTVAARYSGKQYSTLDNTDIISHVYGAFDDYFVVDMKIHYNATQNFSFDFGIDNLFNEQYFLFHPFPGRTLRSGREIHVLSLIQMKREYPMTSIARVLIGAALLAGRLQRPRAQRRSRPAIS